MRIGIWGAFIALLIFPQAGCRRGRDNARKAGEQAEQQRKIEDLLAGKDADGERAMEAREYLADQQKNVLWKTSREQTTKWVDELYRAGAVKVYAVYVPPGDVVRVNVCAALLIELPVAGRKKTIDAFNHIERQLWGPDASPAADSGQKYLHLNMDP
jgi:hypothetical protein